MAEVGCLKDGHFQNLESSSIMLGTASLVAPVETTGKIVFDSSASGAVTMTAATHANSIYFLGKTPSGARAITLPALSTMNAGDKIVFIVVEESGTGSNIVTISEKASDDTNKIIGTVTVVTGGAADANSKLTDLIATSGDGVGVTNVLLSADTSGDDAGSQGTNLVFTCVGSTTKYWLISGIVKTMDPNSTCATLFS